MSVELLDETKPWQVDFPNEDVYSDRRLEARTADGEPRWGWHRSPLNGRWYGIRAGGTTLASFEWGELLALSLNQGWTLHSLPGGSETGGN